MKKTVKALVAGLVLAISGTAAAFDCKAPVKILLTNDDGYQAPGIEALQSAFTKAGFDVTMIAPDKNNSGVSTALNFGKVAVTKDAEHKIYAVGGTPATSVLLGVTGILGPDHRPDLIVSGINEGANIGPATPISGTVGATVAGVQLLQPPVPGLAFSTDLPTKGNPRDPQNLEHFAQVAEFATRLIARLRDEGCATGRIMKPREILNVNYPALPPALVKGVKAAVQGQSSYFNISFQETAPGEYTAPFKRVTPGPDVEDSDTTLFGEGYITVAPLDGDYTAPENAVPRAGLQRGLKDLKP
ncbi:MAG: hypothetical protein HY749_13985 [Gammaproteobacteria bacterium]|nr:hypothetical protein [Gammaproteobacteria bacterium]